MDISEQQLVARSIELIYERLDAPLTVAELAHAVGSSESVLKRAFAQVLGSSPAALSRRLRLEVAFRTLRSRNQSVLETALAAGFADHAAFSRSFRRAFGFAPVGARDVLHLQRELESVTLEEPDIVELAAIALQAVVCQGPYFVCAPAAWSQLMAALGALPEALREQALFVGQALDDPHAAQGPSEHAVRFAAGVVGIDRELGLERLHTRSGTYARFRYTGKLANIGLAYHHIYGSWRERAAVSGYALAAEPALVMFDAPPASDARVLIAVPLSASDSCAAR